MIIGTCIVCRIVRGTREVFSIFRFLVLLSSVLFLLLRQFQGDVRCIRFAPLSKGSVDLVPEVLFNYEIVGLDS